MAESNAAPKKSVLFVCLGNICRSPMAEAIFMDLVKKRNLTDEWKVDSAATLDVHCGGGPDQRTLDVLKKHGICDYEHIVREVTPADFHNFDYILGMDEENISTLNTMQQSAGGKAVVDYLGTYDPYGLLHVEDPYYSRGSHMFEHVFKHCFRCCEKFLDDVTLNQKNH